MIGKYKFEYSAVMNTCSEYFSTSNEQRGHLYLIKAINGHTFIEDNAVGAENMIVYHRVILNKDDTNKGYELFAKLPKSLDRF